MSELSLIIADRREATLPELIEQYRQAENWTQKNDGLTLILSGQIRACLMASGCPPLSKADVDTLGRAL
ncbi:hypothetical protein [Qipengyuania atrilutea]|uniref:Uncharacterized protein n=1 Tax=Qipengyuania atrilutea TaxID=2744473 RepID=A0A850H167_9SPHN|nr:hypothetical protein [Actirhodobacter atriluteus]NVD44357.1 hypothetical protein [Actirhodobacter atriluteus]